MPAAVRLRQVRVLLIVLAVLSAIGLGFAVVLLLFAKALLGDQSTPATTAQPASRATAQDPPEVRTGPMTLWEEYAKNEVGADNKYRDRRLRLTAVVRGIRKDAFNQIILELAATPKRGEIHARFADSWALKIGDLERQELVGLKCTGRGLVLGVPQLADCSLEWSQPKDTEAFAHRVWVSYSACAFDQPGLRDLIRDGHGPDGGAVPSDVLRQLRGVAKETDAEIARGLERLPCDDDAVRVTANCDGDWTASPQCQTPLMKLVKRELR